MAEPGAPQSSLAQGWPITALSPLQITQLKIASNPFAKGFRESDPDSWYCLILTVVPGCPDLVPVPNPHASPKAQPLTLLLGSWPFHGPWPGISTLTPAPIPPCPPVQHCVSTAPAQRPCPES